MSVSFARPNACPVFSVVLIVVLYAATLYRPELKGEPLADNYLVYDRNVQGPRGRFGRWSFAGTTRFLGDGCQGKDTFVGGMVVDEPTRRYPLNAALQVVTNQFRLQPRKPYEGNCRRWRECRYLSQEERNAVTLAADFATLAVPETTRGEGASIDQYGGLSIMIAGSRSSSRMKATLKPFSTTN